MRISQLIVTATTISLVAAMACQKTKNVPAPASFTVIHAMATGDPIVPKLGADTAGRYWSSMVNVSYGGSWLYSPVAGTTTFEVRPVTDTTTNIFSGSLSLVSGGIYSFFLSGDPIHADTLLIKDNIPSYTDSSSGLRFVNLAKGGKALTINLVTDPGHTEFSALGYKQYTEFKKYSVMTTVGGSYTFEIRDQATGDLLTTYTWYYQLFNNNTIIISGSTDPASSTPLNVFSVNNF